ncbi:unnamed protein product [marine sediment metagenome]|uniref:Uncharacterized protein n=1 Tax=marine sediment metagenome TaxID=412755 RepID=X1RKJ9_9ZZZZ
MYSTEAFTAADTLTKEESGKLCTNEGAGGDVALTLPQDAEGGCRFTFLVVAAHYLTITSGAAGAIYLNGTKGSDVGFIRENVADELVTLIAIGNGDWFTVEATSGWAST